MNNPLTPIAVFLAIVVAVAPIVVGACCASNEVRAKAEARYDYINRAINGE